MSTQSNPEFEPVATAPAGGEALRAWYAEGCRRIQAEFEETQDGLAALARRTAMVDALVRSLWEKYLAPLAQTSPGFAVVAIGGYGRGWLFPHSDIDLLFLLRTGEPGPEVKDAIRGLSQELWDARLRLSPVTRSMAECDRFQRENTEFTIALLETRLLAGDATLFHDLRNKLVPRLVARESQELINNLVEINAQRHARFGHTIFHLEPNVKEGPGGLRDFNVACWLTTISNLARQHGWRNPAQSWSPRQREECDGALHLLTAVRCFLHYRAGQDDNSLSWDAQEEASARGIGGRGAVTSDPASWMRAYFRRARVFYRLCSQLLDEVPAARSSLYQSFQSWRTRVSNADFAVVKGRVFLQQPSAVAELDLLMRLFEFVAQHGVPLAGSTEERVEQALPVIATAAQEDTDWWRYLKAILLRPHAALALRSMQDTGALKLVLPEFQPVESLVLRDLYHRYTVDEHTILAVDNLHRLTEARSEVEQRFCGLFRELEQPELLMLALLLHDLGKSTSNADHVQASLDLASPALDRLKLNELDRQTVSALIAGHLEMSARLRRDILDEDSVRGFARTAGTSERLKMFCLLTYADIKAVSPEALTPWKTENLWLLYMHVANIVNRSLDVERIHAGAEDEQVARVRTLAPRYGRRLKSFLEGLPLRYLSLHSAQEIAQHLEMTSILHSMPVQTALERSGSLFKLTLVTRDQPMIFANVAGTLAAWGMNILKADVFTNASGVVVDTFHFSDRFRTLELNLPEWDRLQRAVADVLSERLTVEKLMERRRPDSAQPKVTVPTSLSIDDPAAATSTLVEIVTQDRPGLLYLIARRFSLCGCNIELALIDTQGPMAIDVFYLTQRGKKLAHGAQQKLRQALTEDLER